MRSQKSLSFANPVHSQAPCCISEIYGYRIDITPLRSIYLGLAVMNEIAVPPGLWQEARNPEGRVYYYNVQTKATQWSKPTELMTPVEVRTNPNQPLIQTNLVAASSCRAAMERVHDTGGQEILV